MRIIAIDDESIALKGMTETLNKICPDAEITGFSTVEPAILYAKEKRVDIAFCDIEMFDVNGIELAKMLKETNPRINIIFSTGYREYMEEAFELYCSGYILKPATEEKIRSQLDNLRFEVDDDKYRIKIKTFGDFEVFIDGTPVKFNYSKTKEFLAILVDREGKMCTVGNVISIMWEDEDDISDHTSYMRNLQADLFKVFKNYGLEKVIIKQKGAYGIDTSQVECDLYEFKKGGAAAKTLFSGEYMSQYSWAEEKIPILEEIKCSM